MRTSHSDENLEKIMLTRKEKHLLRRLIKKGNVPAKQYKESQYAALESYGLVRVNRNICTDIGFGVSGITQGTAQSICATDKATRYFLYRKESYFQGKLPVVLSIIALIKSFDCEILLIIHFICDWLSSL